MKKTIIISADREFITYFDELTGIETMVVKKDGVIVSSNSTQLFKTQPTTQPA